MITEIEHELRSGETVMTRTEDASGKKKRAAAPVSIPASLTLTATSVATAISFCRIFPGWSFLMPVVITVIAVHAVMTLARSLTWPIWVAAPVGIVALSMVLGMLYFRSTLFGFVPTRATWDATWQSLADAFSQFRTTVAPVPDDGGYAVATALAMGTVAGLADTFAFRAFGRIESIVPGGLLFALGSSLGVSRNRLPVSALWLGTVILAIAVLRAAHGDQGSTWLGSRATRRLGPTVRAAAALGAIAVIAGVIIGPRIPGATSAAIINTRTRSARGTEALNPLVDIQARLVARSNTEMFTVKLTGEKAYIRTASYGEFDGKTFKPPSNYVDATTGFQPTILGGATRDVHQTIKISSLGSIWLPAIYSAVNLTPTTGLGYNPPTGGLIREDKLYNGLTYDVDSQVSVLTPDDLRASSSASPPDDLYVQLPDDFPGSLTDQVAQITVGATTVYDQMVALEDWFRTNFTYNANVSRGHSIRNIESFLRTRQGYCEQFATTFAAFARTLNVPSRVAVGFTPGDVDTSGVWHVLGKHAHAWPEIWFDSIGWVPFEPTPGRGIPGAETYTGVAEAQAGGVLRGTPDVGNTTKADTGPKGPTATTVPQGTRSTIPKDRPENTGRRTSAAAKAVVKKSGVGPVAITFGALALLLTMWLLFMPVMVRTFGRRKLSSASEQIARSWSDSARWLAVAGAPRRIDETPIEHAERAWRTVGVGRDEVRELAARTTEATFRPDAPTADIVSRCGELSRTIARTIRRRLGWKERFLARLNPRLTV